MRGLIGDARALAASDIVLEAPAKPSGEHLKGAAAEMAARKRILASLQVDA